MQRIVKLLLSGGKGVEKKEKIPQCNLSCDRSYLEKIVLLTLKGRLQSHAV
jgi:hypothetical protein